MQRRKLGRTGYPVSEIGHGTWGMGRTEWLDGEDEANVLRLWEEFERSPGHSKYIVEIAVEGAP